MNFFSGVVVFVLIWWMVFFCTLPFGIEAIETTDGGHMPGAPRTPFLKQKLLITTVISVFLWWGAYLLITSRFLSFHDYALKMPT